MNTRFLCQLKIDIFFDHKSSTRETAKTVTYITLLNL
ncbi:hypothetical protein FHX64_002867 [Microbacter margulisiae]|uniref:Uncharacterized protein n=1 Tax=Microbacter margulisiae TaxID=1350067 RepID=A0A7W5DT90_9PORP|nr:hypothetical protein [Microbacter margulisiae]